MDFVIYILVVLVIVILMAVGYRYAHNQAIRRKEIKEKERIERQKQIDEAIKYVDATTTSQYEYLKDSLLNKEHYFAYSEMVKYSDDVKFLYEKLDFLRCNGVLNNLSDEAKYLYDKIKNIETIRKNHNDEFVHSELEKQNTFFDKILDYPLDSQQRESIVKLEDNCLVISSAGSGKTSTMIGKLMYLVQQRKIQPQRILTITYTHKAAEELTQ